MENNNNTQLVFEDISSHGSKGKDFLDKTRKVTKKAVNVAKKRADNYGNNAFKNIDKVIKLISFIVAVCVFLFFLAGAVVIYFIDKALIFACALVLLFGAAVSLISLFLIYGLGEIITQNKKIIAQNKAILHQLDEFE